MAEIQKCIGDVIQLTGISENYKNENETLRNEINAIMAQLNALKQQLNIQQLGTNEDEEEEEDEDIDDDDDDDDEDEVEDENEDDEEVNGERRRKIFDLNEVPVFDTVLRSSRFKMREPDEYFKHIIKQYKKNKREGVEVVRPSSINVGKRKVVVIGDLHGDIDGLLATLYVARLIDVGGNWIGGDTVIVQLGDQIDRKRVNGSDVSVTSPRHPELEVLQYVEWLNKEAEKQGGQFISLLGNHELIYHDKRTHERKSKYVTTKDLADFGGSMKDRLQTFQVLFKTVYANRGVILKIGNWIFSHGDSPTESMYYDTNDFMEAVHLYITEHLGENVTHTKKEEEETLEGIIKTFIQHCTFDRNFCANPNAQYDGKYKFVHAHTSGSDIRHDQPFLYCIDTGRSLAFKADTTQDDRVHHLERAQSLQIENIHSDNPKVTILKAKLPEISGGRFLRYTDVLSF